MLRLPRAAWALLSRPRCAWPRCAWPRCAWLLAAWLLCGCASHGLEGNVYRGDGFAFRIESPEGGWSRVEASDAALAFHQESLQAAILVNARCGLDGEDIPLKALTHHLFLEFTEKDITQQQVVPFDGREAMHTVLSAKLDGVPMRYDVWVLKKDGCVYDLLYLAPEDRFAQGYATFEQLVSGFRTVQR